MSASTSTPVTCRAQVVVYRVAGSNSCRKTQVLGNYVCDATRPDWEYRWAEWTERTGSFICLYLCTEHARQMALID